MKNRILAILAIFLVTLSGVSINATPVNAALEDEITVSGTLEFSSDGLLINSQEIDTFTLTYSGEGTVSGLTLSYEPADSSDEEITVTFPDGASISLTNDTPLDVRVAAKAERGQTISLNSDTKFGGNVIVKQGSTEIKSIPIQALVRSDLVDINVDEDDLEDPFEPGDSVGISVEVRNNVGEDIEIDEMELSIVDIDDGDDIDVDFDGDEDISEGDREDYDFDFDIPYNVDESKFDVRLSIDIDADSGASYTVKGLWKSGLEVEKDSSRDVAFTTFSLNQANPSCGATINVDVEVVNVGSKQLDDVVVILTVDDTEISERSSTFDLDEKDYDDRETSLNFNLKLPSDLEADEYTLRARAYHEGTLFLNEKTETFTVRCGESSSSNDNSEDNSEDEVIDRNNNGVTGGSTVYVPTSPFGNLFGSNSTGAVVFWVIVDLILLLVAIWLLKVIFRRRKRE